MTANEELLLGIAERLRPVLSELVFVGGATVELYMTDPASARPRPTTDVDVVCEVESRVAYHRLGERIRDLGFTEDMRPGAPIGRWISTDGVLDLMPRDPDILGFTNIWYDLGLATAEERELRSGLTIRVLHPSVFLATKLAAYKGRGGGDPYSSHDVEDMVVVMSGRPQLPDEVRKNEQVAQWVADAIEVEFGDHLREIVAANLPQARHVPGLVNQIVDRFAAIVTP